MSFVLQLFLYNDFVWLKKIIHYYYSFEINVKKNKGVVELIEKRRKQIKQIYILNPFKITEENPNILLLPESRHFIKFLFTNLTCLTCWGYCWYLYCGGNTCLWLADACITWSLCGHAIGWPVLSSPPGGKFICCICRNKFIL